MFHQPKSLFSFGTRASLVVYQVPSVSSKLCPIVFSVYCDEFYSKFLFVDAEVVSCVWVCSSSEFRMRFEICLSFDMIREGVCLSSLYVFISFV